MHKIKLTLLFSFLGDYILKNSKAIKGKKHMSDSLRGNGLDGWQWQCFVSLLVEGYLVDNAFTPHANHCTDSAYVLIRLLFYYCQVMSLNDCNDWRPNNTERAICCASIVYNVYLHFRTFPYKAELGQIFYSDLVLPLNGTQRVGSGLKGTQAIEMTILRHLKGFYLSVDCFQGSEINIINMTLATAITFC